MTTAAEEIKTSEYLLWISNVLIVTADCLRRSPGMDGIKHMQENQLFNSLPDDSTPELLAAGKELQQSIFLLSETEKSDAALYQRHFQLFLGAGRPKAPFFRGYYVETEHVLLGKSALEDIDLYAEKNLIPIEKGVPEDSLYLELAFLAKLIQMNLIDEAGCYLTERIQPWIYRWKDDVINSDDGFYAKLSVFICCLCDEVGEILA